MPERALRIHAGEPHHVVANVVAPVFVHRRQHAVGVLNHPVIEQLDSQLGLAYQPVPHAPETAFGLPLLGLHPSQPGQPALYLPRPALGIPVVAGLRGEFHDAGNDPGDPAGNAGAPGARAEFTARRRRRESGADGTPCPPGWPDPHPSPPPECGLSSALDQLAWIRPRHSRPGSSCRIRKTAVMERRVRCRGRRCFSLAGSGRSAPVRRPSAWSKARPPRRTPVPRPPASPPATGG